MSTTWHHDVYLDGEPYPTRHPLSERFPDGADMVDILELTQKQLLCAIAAHELGHAVLWLAGGLHVSRVSINPTGDLAGHAQTAWTGVQDEARLRAVGTAGGERAMDRWLREAGLWTPDRAAAVELGAHGDRVRLLEGTSPRPVFGGDGLDFTVLHDMADEALDRVWGRLRVVLPVLVRQRVMSGQELAECAGLPLPAAVAR